ncbi:hypothetical protein NPIL_134951 [Nephila pilipes]|uniref:Uncharacterized protein n=1 Tax=Nephila pilipes TaxID=299642 RepID=A0A8X6TRQ7_NEPPI|nr:hypothetical protein NPIL_134951 [Nephila pilipes]
MCQRLLNSCLKRGGGGQLWVAEEKSDHLKAIGEKWNKTEGAPKIKSSAETRKGEAMRSPPTHQKGLCTYLFRVEGRWSLK